MKSDLGEGVALTLASEKEEEPVLSNTAPIAAEVLSRGGSEGVGCPTEGVGVGSNGGALVEAHARHLPYLRHIGRGLFRHGVVVVEERGVEGLFSEGVAWVRGVVSIGGGVLALARSFRFP